MRGGVGVLLRSTTKSVGALLRSTECVGVYGIVLLPRMLMECVSVSFHKTYP